MKEEKRTPEPKSEPAAPAGETKEEWAEMVDVNTPVDDFYKRIPVMAHKVRTFDIIYYTLFFTF